jgi:CRISPR-associated protein Csx10
MSLLMLRLELLSDTLIGSGEGWGASIDRDVVFDDTGLPYIPARRVKGCLRESAIEVVEMFEMSGIDTASSEDIKMLFGKPGQDQLCMLSFSNCYFKDYASNRKWLEWLIKKYPDFFSKEIILNTFSITRQQTAIDSNGIAKDHSLRTSRVLTKGNAFFGEIEIPNEIEERLLSFLALTVRNLRYMGTNRNRGFGSIKCSLLNDRGTALEEKYLNDLENKVKEA